MKPGDTITYTGWADQLMGDGSWKQQQVTNLVLFIEEFMPYEPANYVREIGGLLGCTDNAGHEWTVSAIDASEGGVTPTPVWE